MMKPIKLHPSLALLGVLAYSPALAEQEFPKNLGSNWHHWRGPGANGISETAKPPLRWGEDKNIRWKVPVEGKGMSTPIIWGDKLFLLTTLDTGKVDPSLPRPEDQPKRVFGITHPNTEHEFIVLCLDRKTGKTLWRRVAKRRIPHEGTHRDNDFASASPTTDGQRLYCWFGSAGLFCYDLYGKKLWERDLGKAVVGASLGEGCSPVVHKGRLVIVRDHRLQSAIEVLDASSGRTLWKKHREEGNAWATPAVVERAGKTQVITSASGKVRSYDLDSGEILWECAGLTGNAIPCPVVLDDTVYCMSGYKGFSLLALPLNERGDFSDTDKIRWKLDRGTPYVPSPVLYDGRLYFVQSNQAILTGVDARSGRIEIERTRLPELSGVYASLAGANGRIYVVDRFGKTLVLKHANQFEVLATNTLKDRFHASPALVGDALYLRGLRSLYCIAESR